MTSAYGSGQAMSKSNLRNVREALPYIPCTEKLEDGSTVVVNFMHTAKDIDTGMLLLNTVIEEGRAWPFEAHLSREGFCNYFMSHAAFVVKNEDDDVLGVFYVKPNFPGRSSHFCNGGFITAPLFRGKGVGVLMGSIFKRVAKDLGFKAALFNLVYKSNAASLALWNKLNFVCLGTLPRVGRLKDLGYVDADMYYFDLTSNQSRWNLNTLAPGIIRVASVFLLGFLVGRLQKTNI